MATITISGCQPFDGAYELNFGEPPFTTGDLNIIKQIAGVRSQELEDAFAAGDTDLVVALAVIALSRVGKTTRRQAMQVAEVLWAAPGGSLAFEVGEQEEDARPPEHPKSKSATE